MRSDRPISKARIQKARTESQSESQVPRGKSFPIRCTAILAIILVLIFLISPPVSISAQTNPQNYWQFRASARLQHAVTADMNGDAIDDFILVDENGKLDLLDANGSRQFSYQSPAPVSAIHTLNIADPFKSDMEILLALPNQLILLSSSGTEIWRVPLKPITTPTSIFTGGGLSTESEWLERYEAVPVAVESMDWDGDGSAEILVLLESGQLQLYGAKGQLIWRYTRNINPILETQPQMAVADLNQDEQPEIVLGYFNPQLRFSQLALINRNGRLVWDQELPLSGRITALSLITLNGTSYAAAGTNLGQLHLYDSDRQRYLYRTVNKPITTLSPIILENGPGLVVGTTAGNLIAYDWQGRRSWTRRLAPDAERQIVSLSTSPVEPREDQPALAVVLGNGNSEGLNVANDTAHVVLLANNGRTIEAFTDIDGLGPTQLIDINNDGNNELLVTQSASLGLVGIGSGTSEIATDWDYDLDGSPSAYLVLDFEQDGKDELLIGTENGRIHRLNHDGSNSWIVNPGLPITHLAAIPAINEKQTNFVVARNNTTTQSDGTISTESWVALRQENGDRIWERPFTAPINSLHIGSVNESGQPGILLGTNDGEIIALSAANSELWRTTLPEPIEQLLTIRGGSTSGQYLIAVTTNRIYQVKASSTPWLMAIYQRPIQAVYPIKRPGSDSPGLIVFLAENLVYAISMNGRHLHQWPLTIDGPPTKTLFAEEILPDEPLPQNALHQLMSDSFLLTTREGLLRNLIIENGQPRLSWLLTGLGDPMSLLWGDLDNDGAADLALGDHSGRISLFELTPNARRPEPTDRLELGSRLFALITLQRDRNQTSDLVAVAQNGTVQLIRFQDNLPPLLTNPLVEVNQNRLEISVSIRDVEQDDVSVRLDILDEATEQWIPYETQRLVGNNEQLTWLVEPPSDYEEGIRYRFHYDDGLHKGEINPPLGPLPIAGTTLSNDPIAGLIFLGIFGVIGLAIVLRQTQSQASRARRYYRDLTQDSSTILVRLENKYRHSRTAPGFWLSLANQARQKEDSLIASIADGLFLLENQPRAGLPIILGALQDARRYAFPAWQCLERWELTFRLGRGLLEAPTIMEISLLRPQLDQLLALFDETGHWSPAFESLLPILTNIRDSKRVELAEDSLVYLNNAAQMLTEFREEMPVMQPSVELPLAKAIVDRWIGLVSAAIEELRGRADLDVTLITKRLIPAEKLEVVLAIRNNGRAAAENIIAALDENPAYISNGRPQVIPLLPPGQTRQINFSLAPQVNDRFRLVLNLTYDDRNQRDRAIAFGDMVSLLPPVRDFRPISNPYLPGTPLRRESTIFFGRDELFDFIAESAGRLSQRNVLILVGQRRTGKTSILLRLEHHLPSDLVPIYIDCQSLGVTPGMPALLYDLSWYIADALAVRGIDLTVPVPELWEDSPTRLFQHHFLPQAQSQLPQNTTLLLVFDEFEAFENLVEDGLLPPTLFPYLRHLMQHSVGLSFVFVGTRRLEEMSADYWSVLFNIALYQKIGFLDDDIASKLIQEPVAPNLIYDDLAIDKILRVTAGHPYFLQLVCYTLVKQANGRRKSYITISDVNAALDEMLILGEVHFAYLWQRSDDAERALLTAVAHMMDRDTAFHPTDMLQFLETYGIYLAPAEVTTALKKLVERDIFQEVTEGATALYELKIGLVGLWVAKYKSLSQLYSSNGEQVRPDLRIRGLSN